MKRLKIWKAKRRVRLGSLPVPVDYDAISCYQVFVLGNSKRYLVGDYTYFSGGRRLNRFGRYKDKRKLFRVMPNIVGWSEGCNGLGFTYDNFMRLMKSCFNSVI